MDRLGFIHEKLDIKILILFILRRLPGTVDRDMLSDFTQCDGGVGYFDFSDCLSELVDTGLVTESPEGYRITEKGAQAGETVESSLPFSVRKKAEKLIAPEAERLRRLSMLTAEHKIKDGNCRGTLARNDGKGEVMRLKILSSGEEQAQRIEKNFKGNAEDIYCKLIELLDK